MDKLSAMRAFVEICDRGSLTAAGVALGKSQPTVVRTLAALESELGVRLLRRTTRRLALTEPGRDYLARCRRILAEVEEAERALGFGATEPRGELKLTAPVTFGQLYVAPFVMDFLQRYPAVRLELLLLDRVVNLLEEGVDLAVRIGPLPDSSMIGLNVGTMRRVLVASPEYIEREGIPERPEALAERPCVLFRGLGSAGSWRFQDAGRPIQVNVRGTLVCNQAMPAVAACERGLGFGEFLAYQVADSVAAGRLRTVLERFELPPAPVSLLYSEARLMSPSLRVLVDFMREQLRRTLAQL